MFYLIRNIVDRNYLRIYATRLYMSGNLFLRLVFDQKKIPMATKLEGGWGVMALMASSQKK